MATTTSSSSSQKEMERRWIVMTRARDICNVSQTSGIFLFFILLYISQSLVLLVLVVFLLRFQKTCQTQIDTKLVHETCAGHISRTTCLIAIVSFVSHSPTCTAEPGALSFYNFFLKPFLTSPASICLNLPQVEAT